MLERIAQTLRVPAADLDEFSQLGDLGVDSLTAVEIRLWVHGDLDVDLAVEQLFTAPSIRDLALSIDKSLMGKFKPLEAANQICHRKQVAGSFAQSHVQRQKFVYFAFHTRVAVPLRLIRGPKHYLITLKRVFCNYLAVRRGLESLL